MLSDAGTTSTAAPHPLAQPHSTGGRDPQDSAGEEKVLLQWDRSGAHPQLLTDCEEPCLLAGPRGAAEERPFICKGQRLSTEERTLKADDRHPRLARDKDNLFKAKAGDS